MKIVIIGCGKVGTALARRLCEDGHNITVIDTDAVRIQQITEALDVLGVVGNGSSYLALSEAGVENTDVLIAVTGSDELNLLCCMFAKKVGHCQAVARVRNPAYANEMEYIKKTLGISAIINPELAAAREITELLKFPGARNIDHFADGKVGLIKFELENDSKIAGVSLRDLPTHLNCDILICAVERGGDVIIPRGGFMLQKGDVVSFIATQDKAIDFFKKLGIPTEPVRSALIVGGGTIGYYLAQNLIKLGVHVKIVENNLKHARELVENLPQAIIIEGDGTNRQLLMSEGLPMTEAFVALTNVDEENVILSMFAKKHSSAKIATKINRLEFDDILDSVDIGSVVYPKYITCDFMMQFVRALKNKAGSNIKTLYRILDDRVEALEFTVSEESEVTGKPLAQLRIKPNSLLCCITRDEKVIIPRGADTIQVGDSVIVVSLEKGLSDVQDILVR